jgi:electron transport complex protein RnfG
MREIVKMIVVLALITGVSGLLLAAVNEGTGEQRKRQLLEYVKGPAVKSVLSGAGNNPLEDVKALTLEDTATDIFPAFKDGKLWAVAFEQAGKGYGGAIGVMVAIESGSGDLLGIGITTHKETPGLGARIREPVFLNGFKGLSLEDKVMVTGDGGKVDAISGASISSRAVCDAVNKAAAFYRQHQAEILALVGTGE